MTYKIPVALIRKTWFDDTRTTREAAAALGVHYDTLRVWARMLGLPHRTHRKRPVLSIIPEDFNDMWLAGIRSEDIASLCGCRVKYVGKLAARRGLPPRRRGSRPTVTLAEYLDQRSSIAATMSSNP